MLSVNRKSALAAASAAAVLVGAIVVSAPWGGLQSAGGAAPVGSRPCVATVLPDTYYQAIAEMNACTGTNVTVEIPPPSIPWAIAGEFPTPGGRVIVDP